MSARGKWTDAQKRASAKYMENHDIFRLVMKKGKREEIRKFSEEQGETIGQFINRAIDETMERAGRNK